MTNFKKNFSEDSHPVGKWRRSREDLEILAKAKLKKRRPKLTKKRVFLPAIAAGILVLLGLLLQLCQHIISQQMMLLLRVELFLLLQGCRGL